MTNNSYIYSVSGNKVYCMTFYAGKTIKGIAKCDPEDTFNQESGMLLAKARCDFKLAKKKLKRANEREAIARNELELAKTKYQQCINFQDSAFEFYSSAKSILLDVEKSLK